VREAKVSSRAKRGTCSSAVLSLLILATTVCEAQVFRFIHGKGFKGVVGMEHGNSKPGNSKPGKDGERSVIDAYISADKWA
jgi:hypothetical protein